jgi:dUTP pyrophosphatase
VIDIMNINLVKSNEEAVVPTIATQGSAGADLCSIMPETFIYPGETKLIKTGINISIPLGYAGFVCSRSGLALKQNVFVLNAPGIIDSDYTGEVGVILHNASGDRFTVKPGDRIAQLLVVKCEHFTFNEVKELEKTERGEGGFGSTGHN